MLGRKAVEKYKAHMYEEGNIFGVNCPYTLGLRTSVVRGVRAGGRGRGGGTNTKKEKIVCTKRLSSLKILDFYFIRK